MRRWALAILAAIALAPACGDDERSFSEPTEPEADAGTGGKKPVNDASAKPDAPVILPKRTVFSRNPFGNVAVSDNLIWDGDFEWFTPFAEQYGWVNASQFGALVGVSAFEQVRVGPDCRSGMRCGFLTQNQRVAAVGVAPANGANVEASVWMKVPNGCGDMGATMIACDYAGDPDLPMKDADDKPDDAGWCHYEAVSGVRLRATCLYIEALFGEGEALIDDAVVRATTLLPTNTAIAPDMKSIERARAAIRQYMKPRPPEKTRVREALDIWLSRKR